MSDTAVKPTEKIYPGQIIKSHHESNKFYFEGAKAKLEIWVLSEKVIRIRYCIDYFANDFSYAIKPRTKESGVKIGFVEKEDRFEIRTVSVVCSIMKSNMYVRTADMRGRVINEDEFGFHWEQNVATGSNYVYCSKKNQPGENFFGLGDKSSHLNLTGKRFQNWNTDAYSYATDRDPLYRTIPFYYGLHHGTAYGIFFDNSLRSFFDFGRENSGITSFWAEGGEMCYYFFSGPEIMTVAQSYAHLTGVAPMPPLWAFGFHQSKWSYYPEAKVKELASEFRNRQIPCDVIHLDIDYMDGFRCFTWNKDYFPDPKKMIGELLKDGFKTVVIIDPGIKIDPEYSVYKEAFEKGYFCRRQDGDLMMGKVWPGECNFPDFTNPDVRKWWSSLFKGLVEEGVSGFWNDMNEPALMDIGTFPDDVRHNYDGQRVSHRRGHNVYGMQMARATREGVDELMYPRRPFILTRAGYSGVQRFAAVWTGDNMSTWEHIGIANHQCQRLSISGVSFCGTDIGGFIGKPDGELFLRYIQMAVFHPFFRAHSSSDQGDREPWTFGKKYEKLIRETIELRYKLLPYIYTAFWQYFFKGIPMIRPLTFLSQNDHEGYGRQDEFGLGDQILVCPIQEPGVKGRRVYLPKGKWYNYFTGQLSNGGQEVWVDAPLNEFPFFVKAGAAIPHYPVMQYVGEKPVDELTIHAYYTDYRNLNTIYEDDHDGYDYLKGKISVKKIGLFGNRRELRMVQLIEGDFKPSYKTYKIQIHGLPFKPRQYVVDGQVHKLNVSSSDKTLTIVVPPTFKKLRIMRWEKDRKRGRFF